MSDAPPTRPPQVTLAGWTVIAASLVVVATGIETISGLRSLETRRAIERFVSTPPGDGLGLDLGAVQQILHVAALVAAGSATAAMVLGFHVLRRHRGARIGLTIVAVPLFVSGLFGGGFFSSLVAVAAVLMWVSPAREWFDGTPLRAPAAGPATRPALPTAPPAPLPPRPPDRPVTGPIGPWQHPGQALWAHVAPRPRRPGSVVTACVLTWVFAGLTLLVTTLSLSALTVNRQALLDELHRQNPDLATRGLSDPTIVTATYVLGGVFLVWSAVALALAGFAIAGRRWAWAALIASTAMTVPPLLVGVALGQFALVVPLVAAGAGVAMLLRPEVRRWYTTPERPVPGPPRGGMGA